MSEPAEEKLNASVKVMRSHDYCHFEVQLSSPLPVTIAEIDELRKKAARLTDKAVEQYKIAKANQSNRAELKRNAEWYRNIAESERTPQQKAAIKAWEDSQHRRYDYQDDWEEYE